MIHSRHHFIYGFTLVETLVVIAISAVMISALALLVFTFNNASSYEQIFLQSSNSAGAVIHEIETLVSPADAVLQTHTFSGTPYTSTATTLVLEIPSVDSSGAVIPTTYDYAVFYVTGTTAYRLLQAHASSARVSGTKKLSSSIQALTFTYDSGTFTQISSVTTDVQTYTTFRQNSISDHRREQIRLRNH